LAKNMTELKGLTIRGIRAFSPDKVEKIMFSPPLTLITGENGAGKTVWTMTAPINNFHKAIFA